LNDSRGREKFTTMVPVRDQEAVANAPSANFPRVVVATTAMLSFISFWRAAAIVLNDLGSSAYYAGGIAEEAIGKAAPWFILAIMLFSYAVRSVYIESCTMFVRGGVYRVVKEAMGSTMAKFSVSALMFDYILTGPISGVSAGQYFAGFLNELFRYAHLSLNLPANLTAALFAVVVTIYFWWINIKGIPEGSEKALRILSVTTVMVVFLMGWSVYTAWARGVHLPPWPLPRNLEFSPDALGWLKGSQLPYTIGLIGIFIALGHSVLAMSGEETLAQVYREIEHPKLRNLKKAAFVIFLYSLIFTSLVSFFAVMLIPDPLRKNHYSNLIGGLAMYLEGPFELRLLFHFFVVLVGILILAGAVYTSIVGSNGVLNRVSEDGVLPDWFRQPHGRFGTTHRIINLVVALQLLTIVLSQGRVYLLGEAYAFGVLWSFATKALAVLVLRYTKPGPREFRVPLNPRIGKIEIPLGLCLITLTLLGIAVTNLFTKQVATVSGITFSLVFFGIFSLSERTKRQRLTAPGLDQFHLEFAQEIAPQTVGCRAGNILVCVRNHHSLYQLDIVLDRVNPMRRDVVVLHIRPLGRSGSGEHDLAPDQLFTKLEQSLFTKALQIAEKTGKTIRLAVVAANAVHDAMVRAAQNLKSSVIVVARSSKMPASEQARQIGLAWERLPQPKPHLRLEICMPNGQVETHYLGPHKPHLTPEELDLLHDIWLRFSEKAVPEEVHHHDVVRFALKELEREMAQCGEEEVLQRFREQLSETTPRSVAMRQ
jgi:amino acid transporter